MVAVAVFILRANFPYRYEFYRWRELTSHPGRRILVDICGVHMDIYASIMDLRIDIHASMDISDRS